MSTASIMVLSILVIFMVLIVTSFFIRQKKNASFVVLLLHILIFSLLFTISSIFWTKDIAYNTKSIQHLEFGWPVYFEVQNQDRFEPPFPYLMDRAWEVPSKFIGVNFIISTIINYFFIIVLWLLFFFKKIKVNLL